MCYYRREQVDGRRFSLAQGKELRKEIELQTSERRGGYIFCYEKSLQSSLDIVRLRTQPSESQQQNYNKTTKMFPS